MLSRLRQVSIIDIFKTLYRGRVATVSEAIKSGNESRRCLDGVHQFMIEMFGASGSRLSYRLASTIRAITIIFHSSPEDRVHISCYHHHQHMRRFLITSSLCIKK